MECNRDEALRAKAIAEKKLADKDYSGAKKFGLKAQDLYPELDGISQLLTTTEVYMSAENKVGGEEDWYGVLGVAPSDDDETIRKQYRKLALMLHPDKNKSVGADGAFKLISQAWSLLSDKLNRLAYDQKRGLRGFQQKFQSQSRGSAAAPGVNGFHSFTNRATSKPKLQKNTTTARTVPATVPTPPQQRKDTFWTVCHRCKMHYEYLKVYLNHTLLCPNCRKPFQAVETAPPVNFPQPPFSSDRQHHQSSSNHAHSSNPFNPVRNPAGPSLAAKAANVVQQVNERLKRQREELYAGMKTRKLDDDGHCSARRSISSQMSMGNGGIASGSTNIGYGKHMLHFGIGRKNNRTRELTTFETRSMLVHRAWVEICKKMSEWSSDTTFKGKEKLEDMKQEPHFMKSRANGDSSGSGGEDQAEKEPEAVAMDVPDPDFHDFDMDRTEEAFDDNQVWASYDNDDGMPRFYVFIHKVLSRNPFEVKISWLNSKTNTEFGPINWVGSGFAKSCGELKIGKQEINKSLNSFSQKVEWSKGPRGTILIYPRKGQVWALYRNWSRDWDTLTPDDVIHKYDMIEVLDDYSEEQGVSVVPLVKVPGFRTVFHPDSDRSRVKFIPREEMFRFSHQVPKYILTGKEAQHAPEGCLELDPAATPIELLQVSDAVAGKTMVEDSGEEAQL